MASGAFADRMAELDAVVEQCRGRVPFNDGAFRDTSNRTSRDWPWWSVQLEQTIVDGSEKRRATGVIELNSTRSGEPGSFEGRWRAEIWNGVSPDSIDERGGWRLDWARPTPDDLIQTMNELLNAAHMTITTRVAERNGR